MKSNSEVRKLRTAILTMAAAVAGAWGCLGGTELKTRVLQPPYAADAKGEPASSRWLLDELGKCDESLDLIVLPEFSDVPARIGGAEFHAAMSNNNARLLAACAETAKRCKAILFVNALYETPQGWRNTTHAFDRTGACVGRYFKRHVTAGEHVKLGFDVSYTEEWSEPYMLEIEGIRFGFLTCYDFYFYEAFANIARYKPDVLIGCSLQRSDPLHVLKFINAFCAYNIGAWLVRSSVSLSPDSPVGGSTMVVSPDGKILENLESRPGTITCSFDPHWKYLKPAGFGNPPATHAAYIEIGRRPWQYRPGGSAIAPFLSCAAPKRLCAHRGLAAAGNTLAALGAAAAVGASEVAFAVFPKDDAIETADGVRLEDILRKLSCHAIMNIRLKSRPDDVDPWDERRLRTVLRLIEAFDASGHVYLMSEDDAVLSRLSRIAPEIPRCVGPDKTGEARLVERALAHKCRMIMLCAHCVNQATVERAHAAGLRCNVFYSDDPAEAKKFLEMGIDTILTNDYLPVSAATGLK